MPAWLVNLGWSGSPSIPVSLQSQAVRVTLSDLGGAQAVATDLIPAGCYVWGVLLEVLEAVTGVTGLMVGDAYDHSRWGRDLAASVGTRSTLADLTITALPSYVAATDVVVSPVSGTFTGGTVSLTVVYTTLVWN